MFTNDASLTPCQQARLRYVAHIEGMHNSLPVQDPAGKPGCDFFGLNHYARGVVGFFLNPTNKGPKGIADMGCESSLSPSLSRNLLANKDFSWLKPFWCPPQCVHGHEAAEPSTLSCVTASASKTTVYPPRSPIADAPGTYAD